MKSILTKAKKNLWNKIKNSEISVWPQKTRRERFYILVSTFVFSIKMFMVCSRFSIQNCRQIVEIYRNSRKMIGGIFNFLFFHYLHRLTCWEIYKHCFTEGKIEYRMFLSVHNNVRQCPPNTWKPVLHYYYQHTIYKVAAM